jgi:uncharacterized HAD superfamily protein/hypoxanthine-guanine phosphoribosyltransferase
MSNTSDLYKYISYSDLVNDIKKNLNKVHKGNYDLVVGIPRSGMMPAYIIALFLNTHVTDFESFIENKPLESGLTRNIKYSLKKAHDAKRILLVDDTISSGKQLSIKKERIPENLKSTVTSLAIYSTTDTNLVDIYFEMVGYRRLYEWNVFHRDYLKKACLDIDGVLCFDPTEEQDDDGSEYINFIDNAKPYFIPSYKVHSLVTNRLEKYRSQTESWLKKYNVKYDHLIMLDVPNKSSKYNSGMHLDHKANYFNSNKKLEVFIESSYKEAVYIMNKTGKPVLCISTNTMIDPSMKSLLRNNQKSLIHSLKLNIIGMLPISLKNYIKKIIK